MDAQDLRNFGNRQKASKVARSRSLIESGHWFLFEPPSHAILHDVQTAPISYSFFKARRCNITLSIIDMVNLTALVTQSPKRESPALRARPAELLPDTDRRQQRTKSIDSVTDHLSSPDHLLCAQTGRARES